MKYYVCKAEHVTIELIGIQWVFPIEKNLNRIGGGGIYKDTVIWDRASKYSSTYSLICNPSNDVKVYISLIAIASYDDTDTFTDPLEKDIRAGKSWLMRPAII